MKTQPSVRSLAANVISLKGERLKRSRLSLRNEAGAVVVCVKAGWCGLANDYEMKVSAQVAEEWAEALLRQAKSARRKAAVK